MRNKFQLKPVFLSLLLVIGVGIGAIYLTSPVNAGDVQLIINPTQPNGNNDYYRTQPTFDLRSDHIGDGAIVFKLNSDSWATWTFKCRNISTGRLEPLKFSKGINTLHYASSDCNSKPNPMGTIYSKIVKYDPDSPTISFNFPKDNSTVSQQTTTISGNVSDPTSPINTLTINGVGVGFAINGNFSKQITLNKGLNRIVGVAYDKAGNSTSKELFVTYKPSATNDSQESSTPEETVVSDLIGTVLGNESEEKTSKTSNTPTKESTTSATKSANQVEEEKSSNSEVQGSFFRNNILLTVFILIILSGVGVLAFKTEALNRFFKSKFRKG